jgi:hypothetical protein
MSDYLYSLIRYVPDPARMEPINVGVLLQGQEQLDLKLSPRAPSREIDAATYRKWRHFLVEEVRGQELELFQPKKNSPRFFDYLSELCDGTVVLSSAMHLQTSEDRTLQDILEGLFARLVAQPASALSVEAGRPAGRFRQKAESLNFLKRGMKRHAHVSVAGKKLWMAYRQVENGELIAIDKVEVARVLGATANEIERLPRIREHLADFLKNGPGSKRSRFVLVADELLLPFGDQTQEEFAAMQDDLEREISGLKCLGAEIVTTTKGVEQLVGEIDEKLPRVDTAASNEE